jgi:hypothetical protein
VARRTGGRRLTLQGSGQSSMPRRLCYRLINLDGCVTSVAADGTHAAHGWHRAEGSVDSSASVYELGDISLGYYLRRLQDLISSKHEVNYRSAERADRARGMSNTQPSARATDSQEITPHPTRADMKAISALQDTGCPSLPPARQPANPPTQH